MIPIIARRITIQGLKTARGTLLVLLAWPGLGLAQGEADLSTNYFIAPAGLEAQKDSIAQREKILEACPYCSCFNLPPIVYPLTFHIVTEHVPSAIVRGDSMFPRDPAANPPPQRPIQVETIFFPENSGNEVPLTPSGATPPRFKVTFLPLLDGAGLFATKFKLQAFNLPDPSACLFRLFKGISVSVGDKVGFAPAQGVGGPPVPFPMPGLLGGSWSVTITYSANNPPLFSLDCPGLGQRVAVEFQEGFLKY